MEYEVGVVLALAACALGIFAGFERDRAFYPVMLIVVASYYDLFAIIAGGGRVLGVEIAISAVFVVLAVVGFRTSLWLAALGMLGHAGLDFVHGDVVANAGVPVWWPMFCGTFDAVAGVFLAWRLIAKRVAVRDPSSFESRIRPLVDAELESAQNAERDGDPASGFHHLERAHVLGQASTAQHVRVHLKMLLWALRNRSPREAMGQVLRVVGAATKTWAGVVPKGNTGGANVGPFKAMPIPDDLAGLIATAKRG